MVVNKHGEDKLVDDSYDKKRMITAVATAEKAAQQKKMGYRAVTHNGPDMALKGRGPTVDSGCQVSSILIVVRWSICK